MSVRSFRKVLGRSLLGMAALVSGAIFVSSAAAQVPPIPVPPGGIPGLPPGVPGGAPTGVPGLPPIPGIPAPGGTPAVPNIPGMPATLFSPTGSLLMPAMKDETKKIYQKEIDALAATKKSQVEKIPLLTDSSKEEVNAFAGCDDSGKTFVVLTEGMYQMLDLMSQCRATDETFGTNYCDEYLKELAKQQEGKAKILPLPPGLLDPTKSLDQKKLKRQRQLFQEAAGYVVGHELAHHYMGHLGSACTGGPGGTMKPGDAVKLIKKVVPAVNQINESQSDSEGIKNLLDAGQNEADYKWSEAGGLMVIEFFKKLRDLNPSSVLFTFMKTHPEPEVRVFVVKQTANLWRMQHPGAVTGNGGTGGGPTAPKLPIPTIPGIPAPAPK